MHTSFARAETNYHKDLSESNQETTWKEKSKRLVIKQRDTETPIQRHVNRHWPARDGSNELLSKSSKWYMLPEEFFPPFISIVGHKSSPRGTKDKTGRILTATYPEEAYMEIPYAPASRKSQQQPLGP